MGPPWEMIFLAWVLIIFAYWLIQAPFKRDVFYLRFYFLLRNPARWIGKIYNWFKGGWRPQVIRLIIVASIVLISSGSNKLSNLAYVGLISAQNPTNASVVSASTHNATLKDIALANMNSLWFYGATIITLWAILEFILLASNARGKVLVEDFSNDSENGVDGKLVAKMLAIKLADLNSLYSKANEIRAIPTVTGFDQPLQASIKIDDVNTIFKDVFAKSTPANLGWLQVQINSLIWLIGQILQGPNLTGSISRGEDDNHNEILIISAHIHGGKLPYRTWQIKRRSYSSKFENLANSSERANLEAYL
jgi:hypothetical protein